MTHVGVNGSNVKAQLNHLWNMMQGITSDGGSLYYNIGGAAGSGTGNVIDSNIVHDTTDSVIIDGFGTYHGTGYGGEGIYLDAQSADVAVTNNVVYHISSYAAWVTEGHTTNFAQSSGNLSGPNSPNEFENNIFSLAIQGMFAEGNPWPAGSCPSSISTTPFTTNQLLWNIWNTDLNEDLTSGRGTFAQSGCTNSCGESYYQFQDFEANAYWRTNTANTGYPLFCSDKNAYHILSKPSSTGSCPGTWSSTDYDWLTFTGTVDGLNWQKGGPTSTPVVMDEDDGQDQTTDLGVCGWVPDHSSSANTGFGTTGQPSDYTLVNGPPNNPFNASNTNATIMNAGRQSETTIPTVFATFPTYTYPTSTQNW